MRNEILVKKEIQTDSKRILRRAKNMNI